MDTGLSKLEHDKAESVWSGSHEELDPGAWLLALAIFPAAIMG